MDTGDRKRSLLLLLPGQHLTVVTVKIQDFVGVMGKEFRVSDMFQCYEISVLVDVGGCFRDPVVLGTCIGFIHWA